MHIAFIADGPLGEDDEYLLSYLRQADITWDVLPWNEPSVNAVDWAEFDVALFRCPLAYYKDVTAFQKFSLQMRKVGIPVLNTPETLLWNMNKTYLLALQEQGVLVIPTLGLERGDPCDVSKLRAELSCDDLIIKPSISASAFHTYKITPNSDERDTQNKIAQIVNHCGTCLVQPYLPEIVATGEYSLIYFNGVFSHAVLKTPAENDFRVQSDFGGAVTEIIPEPQMLLQVQNIFEALPQSHDILYARIDGVSVEDQFILMEAELFEPELFFRSDKKAPTNFVDALENRLKQF